MSPQEEADRYRNHLRLILGAIKTDDPIGDREHMRRLARLALELPDPRRPQLRLVEKAKETP